MACRRLRGRPSEARLKFFDETFLQKSFDLALDLHRRAAQERKLGKQRSVFPDRPSAWALNSRGLHPGQFAPWGSWSPVGTVQRLVSAAASVGAGRLPLADSTRAGRRDWRLNAAPVRTANARARRGQVALSVMPLACHLPQRGRRDLAPPLGELARRSRD